MGKIATIVPKAHLDLIKYDSLVFILAHLLDDPQAKLFYSNLISCGAFTILDYPAIEKGDPCHNEIPSMFRRACDLKVSELILPDCLEAEKNFEMGEYAVNLYNSTYSYQHPKLRLMFVPHAKTVNAWINQAGRGIYELCADTIGISYRHNDIFPNRTAAFMAIESWCKERNVEVHFLGCNFDPGFEVVPGFRIGVRSVDSAIASVFTKHSMYIDVLRTGGTRPPRSIDFVNDFLDSTLLSKNIEWWRRRCNGQI